MQSRTPTSDLMPFSRRLFLVFLLLGSAMATAPQASSAAEAMRPAGLHLPSYETHTLDNGLTLLLMRHGEVPLVNFEMWILDGAAADPQGQEGLASLTARSLRKGAGKRGAAAFSESLDFLGANFRSSVDHDRTRIAMQCLSKDFNEGLALYADAILRPAFLGEEIEKLKGQMAENVRQAKDNPRFVVGKYHDAHLFGDHSYGRPVDGNEKSLLGISAQQVKSFYLDHYGAERAVLAVVGDIDPALVLEKLQQAFAEMPSGRAPMLEIPTPAPFEGNEVLLVDKPDTPQTWFLIGNLGPKWGEKDDAAVELVRTVFGGRFTSWLNTKLRIESGLSYGARFTIDRRRRSGSGFISSFTAKETTREALDLTLATLDRLHQDGLNAKELASAKAYLKGQMPYRFETGGALATTLCRITAYDLGRNSIDGFFGRIDATSLDDCRQAIETWFPEKNLAFTCIGVASEIREVLTKYGKLRVRKNSEVGFH